MPRNICLPMCGLVYKGQDPDSMLKKTSYSACYPLNGRPSFEKFEKLIKVMYLNYSLAAMGLDLNTPFP